MLISAKLAPVFPYDVLERFWRDADELGFYAVWNYDHFYGLGGPTEQSAPTLEAWTTLAAMAKVIERARVGCMVTGVTYRHPAVLANMAVTVDHISSGRLEFGIGAAWHQSEHDGYGLPFPSAGTRIAMLDEALDVIRALWTQERATYAGTHFTLDDALCYPKPVQEPHPPIVIGGSGRNKTLRVVAKHADEWNGLAPSAEQWAELNAVLDAHCAEVGRDPRAIRRSAQLFLFPAQPEQIDEQLASIPRFADAGCEHVVLSFYQPPDRGLLERVAPK